MFKHKKNVLRMTPGLRPLPPCRCGPGGLLFSRFITPITHMITQIFLLISLLSESAWFPG